MAFSEFNYISIEAISSAVPDNLVNIEASSGFNESIGIKDKYVALPGQTASDLGFVSASRILEELNIDKNEIGILVFVTRTPDYRNPASAAVIQYRLGIPVDCLVYDVNLGGTGFISGLQMGCSLMQSMNKPYGLVIIGDTPSRLTKKDDANLFGYADGATTLLLKKSDEAPVIQTEIHSFGDKYNQYIHRTGAFRYSAKIDGEKKPYDLTYNLDPDLKVAGQSYFDFIAKVLPEKLKTFLNKSGNMLNDYDIIAINQERKDFMNRLVEENSIPKEKVYSNIEKFGHMHGVAIPILLADIYGNVNDEDIKLLSINFGEGLSLGLSGFSINSRSIMPLSYTNNVFAEGGVSRDV